ncbi:MULTISPECIES: RNA polymerase sigma factor [Dictyoglomus]|jgi:RNA polymerase sigma-70 factor (ECF subfamily)|uniref:RNA polymerase, sigma-24 subunit, ECF subfamily n=1 Tax=Dictyoglomus turgidum (strain DSM 6724 / Z-1310) TaxID=515635 RepID=B8E041_DICTD|nr:MULTISPECIES: sigma-70 family RNA polymerase sigma factor [Dictyoglomus]ACK42124.1 RNA polymerase, sigma-24 subunit, ECF subfamily [Dictyoglomus turgidum DSM 6724]HBU32355.1 RNA polymerase subunit sigma [Dictyoglomus sp.]
MEKSIINVIKGKYPLSTHTSQPSPLGWEEKNKLSDQSLISLIKNGDKEAFNILVKRYEKKVLNILYLQLGNIPDLEDLAQEVFIKIFKNIKGFRGEAKFSTWIYRITMNVAYDYKRKNKEMYSLDEPMKEDEEDTFEKVIPSEEEDPLSVVEREDIRSKLQKLIRELPKEYQEVLILREYEGLSYEEISNILKCPVGTVESRLFRARRELKEKLLREVGSYAL